MRVVLSVALLQLVSAPLPEAGIGGPRAAVRARLPGATLTTEDFESEEGLKCAVPKGYTDMQLEEMQKRSCGKVKTASKELQSRGLEFWEGRIKRAEERCAMAKKFASGGKAKRAAYHAINAWGTDMMDGTQCCTLIHPPFCLDMHYSQATLCIAILFGVLLLMFGGASIASCLVRNVMKEPQFPPEARKQINVKPAKKASVRRPPGTTLEPELEELWLKDSCLRVLPGADNLARSAASLFSSLRENFDFQEDNVRNQFDHLLSLWRSHCSVVADRFVEKGVQVNESVLLVEALGELHTELLEGFREWRQKFWNCEAARMDGAVQGLPPLGGLYWELVPDCLLDSTYNSVELSRQLAEIAAYLLVWGEAGNVRFMPEVVYFITDLALAADNPGQIGLYRSGTRGPINAFQSYRSGLFLSKIIRPIYTVIFDEWYEYVDVDEKTKKDKKKLHQGYDRFLPPDVANYDDWNELFCEPSRLAEGLLLEDGMRFFEVPHGQRYMELPYVDWAVSLDRFETKTHREVHSLWGVWASSHRVWLVHLLLFLLARCLVTENPLPRPAESGVPLAGSTTLVRFAALGLIVPVHGLLWAFARWETSGHALLKRNTWVTGIWRKLGSGTLCFLPVLTYAGVRYTEETETELGGLLDMNLSLAVHFVVSVTGLAWQLLVPVRKPDWGNWTLTRVSWQQRAIRYIFWFIILSFKFVFGLNVLKSLFESMRSIDLIVFGHQSITDIASMYYSATWGASFLKWSLLWLTASFLFLVDTQMWFVVGCTILGVATVLMQRRCMVWGFSTEDAISKIPKLFSRKVFTYSPAGPGDRKAAFFSPYFPLIWDRMIAFMRYEDKCDNQAMGDMSFYAGQTSGTQRAPKKFVTWGQLTMPLRRHRKNSSRSNLPLGLPVVNAGHSSRNAVDQEDWECRHTPLNRHPAEKRSVKVPELFRARSICERGCKHYCSVPDPSWPKNPELQWRLIALSRSLGLPMPRPFRAPYIPGITVLIPHYGESIIMEKNELYSGFEEEEGRVPLMDWLQTQYEDEFRAFTSRMQANMQSGWAVASSQWEEYEDHQWEKICTWASMRMQTLFRTVAGMTLYHSALQCHFEAQADRAASLAREDVWKPSDVFTCMVAMQSYCFFSPVQLEQTNKLLEKFPDSLKIAFIHYTNKKDNNLADGTHPRQRRRYFSCLIDRHCECNPDGRRVPRFRVELPGYPILGDGKGDNQNHAIPFMRGIFAQCIDSNQGAYFEQMLLLPCVLGEFRTRYRGDNRSKQIIGLPEHITSDIGSIGDFAAGSEMAFGTILQRSYSVLGARMHYGHPDIMNKQFMMQQGGVSKATKTLNLSEDIFAGMDFTLRGGGRKIKHSEYFHLAKGRDLGFNSVLVFFSKLSSGSGEQILTRQMFRLGQIMHLPETLSFYYAHVGFYITQFFVSWSIPVAVFTWLLVLTADCEDTFRAFQNCSEVSAAQAMAKTLSVWYSWLMVFFLITTSMPLFFEVWMQRSLRHAVMRTLKQYGTGSFLHFIFQAKIIGCYVVNELRYGGAMYMPTGRGLPTERRPFIGTLAHSMDLAIEKVGGLYLDYCMHTYYSGMSLLGGAVLVYFAGGVSNAGEYSGWDLAFTWFSIALTIISWLLAPFLFNPYQFSLRYFKNDLRVWYCFFFDDYGKHWIEWYDRVQLQRRIGFRTTVIDLNFGLATFFGAVWFATLNQKLSLLQRIHMSYDINLHAMALIPPVGMSFLYCCLVSCPELCIGGSSKVANALRRGHGHLKLAFASRGKYNAAGGDESELSSSGTDGESQEEGHEEEADFTRVGLDHEVMSSIETDSEHEQCCPLCCPRGIPLIVSSAIVSMLQLIEVFMPLNVLHQNSFDKAFIAGLVLKIVLYSVVIVLMEGVIRSRCFRMLGGCQQPLDLWVHANRMARDFLTSLFLLCLLTPFVLLSSLNDSLCSGCSVHQLLIYRDPGHLARKEATIVNVLSADFTSFLTPGDDQTETEADEEELIHRMEGGSPSAGEGSAAGSSPARSHTSAPVAARAQSPVGPDTPPSPTFLGTYKADQACPRDAASASRGCPSSSGHCSGPTRDSASKER